MSEKPQKTPKQARDGPVRATQGKRNIKQKLKVIPIQFILEYIYIIV